MVGIIFACVGVLGVIFAGLVIWWVRDRRKRRISFIDSGLRFENPMYEDGGAPPQPPHEHTGQYSEVSGAFPMPYPVDSHEALVREEAQAKLGDQGQQARLYDEFSPESAAGSATEGAQPRGAPRLIFVQEGNTSAPPGEESEQEEVDGEETEPLRLVASNEDPFGAMLSPDPSEALLLPLAPIEEDPFAALVGASDAAEVAVSSQSLEIPSAAPQPSLLD